MTRRRSASVAGFFAAEEKHAAEGKGKAVLSPIVVLGDRIWISVQRSAWWPRQRKRMATGAAAEAARRRAAEKAIVAAAGTGSKGA